jgi:hypothetical protein
LGPLLVLMQLFSLFSLNTPSRCRLFYFFGLVIRCKESRPFDFSSHAQLFSI